MRFTTDEGLFQAAYEDKGVWEKIQITQDPDCVSCKIIGMLTLYGAGILVLTNVRKVPQSNKVGRFGMGVFGIV
ncbi:hypothetical protein QZH41_007009 [Actinostola sp. cb2023]|nr:hypothetical protein QZH41_007009 [Actinostola sp. cb2023]